MFAGLLLAIASTAAAAVQTSSSLLEPVAQMVMQATPVDVANVLLQRLGPASRPLALLGAVAVVLAAGGVIGAIAGTGWMVGRTVAGRNPSRLGAGGGESRRTRRAVFDSSLVVAGAGTVTGIAVADAARRDRMVDQAVRRVASFAPPPGRVPGFPVPGQPDEVTPVPRFYVVSKNTQDPALDWRLWRLRIGGLVRQPITLTFDDLLALPRRHEYVTLECVSNPVGGSLISNAYWSGTPLASLIERAGPLASAGRVVMSAPDGHEESVPLAVAMNPENLIAYAMNGELLMRLHGHPARGLIPGLYGFKQVKWLTRIELAPESHVGYWPQRGWTDAAIIRTTARIDVARRQADRLVLAGMALAGRRSISGVEVRLVDGAQAASAWIPAELHVPPLSNMTWVQWRALLPPPPGAGFSVEVRAVDGEGEPQETAQSGPFPNGASGYHRVQVKE